MQPSTRQAHRDTSLEALVKLLSLSGGTGQLSSAIRSIFRILLDFTPPIEFFTRKSGAAQWYFDGTAANDVGSLHKATNVGEE